MLSVFERHGAVEPSMILVYWGVDLPKYCWETNQQGLQKSGVSLGTFLPVLRDSVLDWNLHQVLGIQQHHE